MLRGPQVSVEKQSESNEQWQKPPLHTAPLWCVRQSASPVHGIWHVCEIGSHLQFPAPSHAVLQSASPVHPQPTSATHIGPKVLSALQNEQSKAVSPTGPHWS
jgi:hypothetical protein